MYFQKLYENFTKTGVRLRSCVLPQINDSTQQELFTRRKSRSIIPETHKKTRKGDARRKHLLRKREEGGAEK